MATATALTRTRLEKTLGSGRCALYVRLVAQPVDTIDLCLTEVLYLPDTGVSPLHGQEHLAHLGNTLVIPYFSRAVPVWFIIIGQAAPASWYTLSETSYCTLTTL